MAVQYHPAMRMMRVRADMIQPLRGPCLLEVNVPATRAETAGQKDVRMGKRCHPL